MTNLINRLRKKMKLKQRLNNKNIFGKRKLVLLLCIIVFTAVVVYGQIKSQAQRLPWPISSSYSELGPTISLDSKVFIFQSNRSQGKGSYDLYESKWKNGRWQAPQNIKILNTKFFEGFAKLSPDGNTIYFSSNRHTLNIRSKNYDLYVAKRLPKGGWAVAKPMGFLNSPYVDASVSFSANGKTVYFSSNRKGSVGKMDIWYSQKINNVWQPPKALPKPINSKANEMNPVLLLANDRLFFSSDRKTKKSKGGFDIYYAKRKLSLNSWSEANLTSIDFLNSSASEELFTFSDNGASFYISQGANNQENLLELSVANYLKINKVSYIQGRIIDEQSRKYMENVKIKFEINYPNLIKNSKFLPLQKNIIYSNSIGKFNFFLLHNQNYLLKIDQVGYQSFRKLIRKGMFQRQERLPLTIFLDSKPFSDGLKSVSFLKFSYKISEEMSIYLDKYLDFLKTKDNDTILLYGYSGRNEARLKKYRNLGFLRAQQVKKYFLTKGVNKKRVKIMGQAVLGKARKYYSFQELKKFRIVEIKLKKN